MAQDRRAIPILKVKQWLSLWDTLEFDKDQFRSRPESHFLMFSLAARDLRRLSGIERRDLRAGPRSKDLGIQRRHEKGRSDEIALFVKYGFPWSGLSLAKRNSGEFNDLRKPGWLPTAIVVNIRGSVDRRTGAKVPVEDRIEVVDSGASHLLLPEGLSGKNWQPKLHPIEIIDGQHRLWAFEGSLEDDFELPVVAFLDLDISWQAYLFWTINIKPKKINASLAYDLYPLLRAEDWLERFEGHPVYRESRSQELTATLWSHEESPWHQRINMLGEGRRGVSQAAWVRSLMTSYVKRFDSRGGRPGGLFGAALSQEPRALDWTRVQQAAFLIYLWQGIQQAIAVSDAAWAVSLRAPDGAQDDAPFSGSLSLLNTDQGIRAALHVTNDILYVCREDLRLSAWVDMEAQSEPDSEAISRSVSDLRKKKSVTRFIQSMSEGLATYDWRTAAAPGLSEAERTQKLAFRGTGGYRELRRRVLQHLMRSEDPTVASSANAVFSALGYEES